MPSVRSVAESEKSSGATNTYAKKKHRNTRPAMVITAGTGLGLLTNSRASKMSSMGTHKISPRRAQVWALRKNFV